MDEEQYIFPFFDDEIEEYEEENTDVLDDTEEIYKDIAWDFENNTPIISNGDFVIVEGLEAIKSWTFRTLQTERYKHEAFTWDYALDLEQFVGKVLMDKEKIDLTIEIKECLMQNIHITNVIDFKFTTDKRKITISFKIVTDYGELSEEVTL